MNKHNIKADKNPIIKEWRGAEAEPEANRAEVTSELPMHQELSESNTCFGATDEALTAEYLTLKTAPGALAYRDMASLGCVVV